MSPRVVLVGLPGTGKTSTGRRLAKIIAVPFADSDEIVQSAQGRSVREIFDADGEWAFRRAECAAVTAAMRYFDGVLSLGGGALTHRETRTAVENSGVPVVALVADRATLRVRVGDGTSRPLLAADPDARLAELERERAPIHAAVATLTVDTEDRTPGQVAATIAARLHEMRRT